jgi:hypothetical protein
MPMISRVRRCASQRSTQAKIICMSSRLKAANASKTSCVQGNNAGFANPTPSRIPNNHKLPRALAGSNAPYAIRTRKYER